MNEAAARLAAALDADGVLLFAVDGEDLLVAGSSPADAGRAAALRIPVGFGITGRVAREGRSLLLPEDSPRNRIHRQLLGLSDGATISRLCVPIRGLYDEVVGVLAAHRSPPRPFDAGDVTRANDLVAPLGPRMHAEQLWRAVHRHRDERDELISQAISAQEDERRRIAFDLHDGVTTVLASMAFHLSAAELATDGEHPARPQIEAARRLADLAYDQTRAAISGLHSMILEELGLVAALESLVQDSPDDGPDVELLTDAGAGLEDVPAPAAAALYRIAQEALGNAVKHSKAHRIVLSLRRAGGAVVLGCSDDGVGFDPAEQHATAPTGGHFGLSSIRQRCALLGAGLRLESMPGRGTTVIVELALP